MLGKRCIKIVEANSILITKLSKPLCTLYEASTDDQYLKLLTNASRTEVVKIVISCQLRCPENLSNLPI